MRIIRLSFLRGLDPPQRDIILYELFIVAQLELQDLDTCSKVLELLNIVLEEAFLAECPEVFQGLRLNLLG